MPSATWKIAQLCSRSRIVPSASTIALGEVALLGLDDGQLADAVGERRIRRDSRSAMLVADPVAELAPPRREDLVEQVVAADRLDRGEQAGGEAVVVRREEVLGVGRDVVQVARPADAVADGLAADELGRLERAELLEDAGPAGAEALGELVGRARAVEPEAQQELATEAGRTAPIAPSRPSGARRSAAAALRMPDGSGSGIREG